MNEDLQVSKRNRFLAIIQKESDRLKRLIEDILLLSSIENKNDLVKESISLYDVFKEVYDMINYIASSKNIDLSYEFEDDKVVVQAYGDYMKQLLLNLIDNAIKYTPNGGKVIVKQFTKDNNIIIEVIDNGTGLGLAITKHIVNSLNGSISVESEFGEGSKFIVKLPKKIS